MKWEGMAVFVNFDGFKGAGWLGRQASRWRMPSPSTLSGVLLTMSLAVAAAVLCVSFEARAQTQSPAPAADANLPSRGAEKQTHKAKRKAERSAQEAEARDPTTAEIVDVVVSASDGETTMKSKSSTTRQWKVCTEWDVARAKVMCPTVGRRYSVQSPKSYQEEVKCAAVPTELRAWSVTALTDGTWRASAAGRSWRVSKASGDARQAGTAVRIASFSFTVRPDKLCAG